MLLNQGLDDVKNIKVTFDVSITIELTESNLKQQKIIVYYVYNTTQSPKKLKYGQYFGSV